VFGDRASEIAISGTKSMTGHLMGAAGAIEGVFTVLSVYHQLAPATLNYSEPDPEIRLNVIHGESRPMEIRYAMSDNIGLGGHNGAVVFKRYDGD
jgi:3-oxoacyl-(acyl-carrier-protein) synthase